VNQGSLFRVNLYVICVLLATSSFGCDVLKSFKQYFSKDKQTSSDIPQPSMQSNQPTAPAASANVLASVGNWTLTVEDFQERLNALKEIVPDYDVTNLEAKKLVLEELIRQQLLVSDAEQSGIASDKDIKAAVEEFRRTLIVREVARKLTQDLKISDEEAKAFYEENKAALIKSQEFSVREIVVADEAKASELAASLSSGGDFAEAAKQNSIGETASSGGDLGFITEAPFAEMADVLLALEVGKPSSVFKGPQGFYVVKIEEKRGGEQIPYDEVKEQIVENRLLFKQQQTLLDHIEKVRAKTAIQVNEGLLK
jgi:parvulin-like peptidyl-prolyl isomerase